MNALYKKFLASFSHFFFSFTCTLSIEWKNMFTKKKTSEMKTAWKENAKLCWKTAVIKRVYSFWKTKKKNFFCPNKVHSAKLHWMVMAEKKVLKRFCGNFRTQKKYFVRRKKVFCELVQLWQLTLTLQRQKKPASTLITADLKVLFFLISPYTIAGMWKSGIFRQVLTVLSQKPRFLIILTLFVLCCMCVNTKTP